MIGFADDTGFDLAWLPAPFLPQPAVAGALPRVAAALHPGRWPVLGYSKSGSTPVEDTFTRLKTVAYGGTPLDEAAACHLLHKTGLTLGADHARPVRGTSHRYRPETGMTNTPGPDESPRTTIKRGPPDRPDLRAPVDERIACPKASRTAGVRAFSSTSAVTECDIGPRNLRAPPGESGLADACHQGSTVELPVERHSGRETAV